MVPINLKMDPDLWMQERIQLFRDFCYPSVKNQSNKNFKWIIFFDSRTPKRYLDLISKIDKLGIIFFLFTDDWGKLDGEIRQLLYKEKGESEFLISSRIDCDDAISYYFIQSLQDEVMKIDVKCSTFLNPLNGVILDFKTGIYFLKKMESNPFVSLVQISSNIDISIFGIEHQSILTKFNIINIESPKMWLQVIHGNNLVNKPSGMPSVTSQQVRFNLMNKSIPKPGFKKLMFEYLKYLNVRFINLKVKISRVFKKQGIYK